MKVSIAGIDGYLGWALALKLANRGHQISGIDNLSRRENVHERGSWSATPIPSMQERVGLFKEATGSDLEFYKGDLRNTDFVDVVMELEEPDAIVHLGEIPSAPYSMIDAKHCNYTQMNNIVGTNNVLWAMKKHVPDCHMVKLGTMGEYGIWNIDIAEGWFDIEYKDRKEKNMWYPRKPGSFYHCSKVHDSHNIWFACRNWDLTATDIHQGVVHGIKTKDMTNDKLLTRFDFDACWGTALNRFCAQAVVDHKLTPYGKGDQTRGYIALRDSMQCITLALENPPQPGEYRVLNQFDECYSVNELAQHVVDIGQEFDLNPEIWNYPNPRNEPEEHYYNPEHEGLYELGFRPTYDLDDELRITIPTLMKYKDRIEEKREHILPRITWND